jgi:hypothetical protein
MSLLVQVMCERLVQVLTRDISSSTLATPPFAFTLDITNLVEHLHLTQKMCDSGHDLWPPLSFQIGT